MLSQIAQQRLYQRLGEYIKHARLKKEIKQEALSEIVTLSRISIVNIESGKQKIQLHTLIEIIRHLDISVSDLFEKLNSAIDLDLEKKLQKEFEKKVPKEINPDNLEEIKKIREFINFTISKEQK